MSGGVILLLIYALISIVFSFLCSIWEAVLLSVTPAFTKRLVSEENKLGFLLQEYKSDIDRPLSAILTLNTISHTVGAIMVGVQASTLFGDSSIDVFGIPINTEGVIAAVMTLAILILSEIIPKTIGATNWKSLTPFTVNSLRIIIFLLWPLIWLSKQITGLFKKNKSESVLSRGDFKAMAEMGGDSGALNKSEYNIINNLLGFEELTAKDIMTPRTVIKMAAEDMNIKDFYESFKPHVFSRIPLFKDDEDEITGVVLKDEVLTELVEGNNTKTLGDKKRKPIFLANTTKLPAVLDKLSGKQHMGIVVNEFGGLVGLVTLEDVIETLFGKEILDETDTIGDLQAYARKKWEERAKKLGLIE